MTHLLSHPFVLYSVVILQFAFQFLSVILHIPQMGKASYSTSVFYHAVRLTLVIRVMILFPAFSVLEH